MAADGGAPAPFDAVVLALSPHARARVSGVTLVERGRRVAAKLGARRIFILESAGDAAGLAAWAAERGDHALLVVQAGDQLVHLQLAAPLFSAERNHLSAHPERSASNASAGSKDQPRRIAVGPDGAYAGALWAEGASIDEVIAAIAASPATADRDLAARWTDAARVPHGPIARHAATTPAERRAAGTMLLGLIVKGEDGPVTRWFYRPVSRVLTRFLVHTPIAPNQVSIFVGLLGLLGCWLTSRGDYHGLWLGAALVLLAGFIDGCDGEIARIKLQFSPIGAWLDTIIDEATTTLYLVAVGLHTWHRLPEHRDLIEASLWIGAAAYLIGIYCIYFFLIVVSKTGNSQHYVSRLEIVEDELGPALRKPPPTASSLPLWLRKVGVAFSHVIRRDFINLGSVVLGLADQYLLLYAIMWLGGVIMLVVVVPDHVRLRRQLRALRRRGAAEPRLLAS